MTLLKFVIGNYFYNSWWFHFHSNRNNNYQISMLIKSFLSFWMLSFSGHCLGLNLPSPSWYWWIHYLNLPLTLGNKYRYQIIYLASRKLELPHPLKKIANFLNWLFFNVASFLVICYFVEMTRVFWKLTTLDKKVKLNFHKIYIMKKSCEKILLLKKILLLRIKLSF